MYKKFTAVILSIVMLFALAVPAMAADKSLDEELARVTKTVKETLGINDSYTKFDGNVTNMGENSYWYLNWSSDEESISVTADPNGKVLSYYCGKKISYKVSYGYSPVFPKADKDAAKQAAKTFVEKLLSSNETAYFNENEPDYSTRDISSYNFSGYILLNGVKSPIGFYVNVLTDGMSVNSFRRSDLNERYTGGIPSPAASVSAETAAGLLSGTVNMKLNYVLSEDGKTAVLQYLPVYTGNYVVKADTGELVNLNDSLLSSPENYGKGADSAAASGGLTQVELSAIAGLEGVYSKEKLDFSLRSVSALGIDAGYVLQSASYSKDTQAGTVYCQLTYIKKISDESAIKDRYPDYYASMEKSSVIRPVSIYKYIMVDAKNAGLKYVSTSTSSGYEEKSVLSTDKLTSNASEFLKSNFAQKYPHIILSEDSDKKKGNFIYYQAENGVPFPSNSISISIDNYDGSVKNLYLNWKDDVTFEPNSGTISADKAKEAYLSYFKPVLQYVKVPTDNDYNVFLLLLAYKFESAKNIIGIDADTGEAIIPANATDTSALAYDDISGCYGKAEIEALAKYRVGFPGKSFRPEEQLTQKDALILLLSAVGYGYDGKNDDVLYDAAYRYNLLTAKEKDPAKVLTRAEFIKILVGGSEYGAAGKLNGIFVCGFNDDASIPAGYYGFVAIAKALKIVKGDIGNNFNPLSPISRQDSAIMLFNYMSR